MFTQQVIIQRVFDSHQGYRGRGGPKCTRLGIEVAGVRHFSLLINGWHDIQPSPTVTAIFRSPNDWKQLVGWVNHQTGEIISTSPSGSLFFVVPICILFAAWLAFLLQNLWLLKSPSLTMLGIAAGTIFLCIVVVNSIHQLRRYKIDLQILEKCKLSLKH